MPSFVHWLFAAYLELKKAFDVVHHELLWNPETLGNYQPYNITESAVKFGEGLSSCFSVSSGVRQGYVHASILFNACMVWIMGRT